MHFPPELEAMIAQQLAEIWTPKGSLPPKVEPFKNHNFQRSGFYTDTPDPTHPTQWSYYFDGLNKRHFLLVNLEGKKYQDWPIAQLLDRELRDPKLPNLSESLLPLDDVELIVMRDSWLPHGNRETNDDFLASTPKPLTDVTREFWRKVVLEGLNCLSQDKNGRGRGKRIVSKPGGGRRETETTPHLQFRLLLTPPEISGLTSYGKFIKAFSPMWREGCTTLEPLYDFVAERSAA